MKLKTLTLMMVLASVGSGAAAAPLQVDAERSVLAIVTPKGGVAKRFAHDHFISASGYALEVDFDGDAPLQTQVGLELDAAKLDVDRDDLRERWHPRIVELGLLDEPFRALDDEDREKIREAMLSKKQLDVESFPKIRARIVDIREKPTTIGETTYRYEATLELEVHDTKVRQPFAVDYTIDGDRVTVDGLGSFRFTEFGFKPYAAMMGMVRNKDEFHVLAHLELSVATD